MSLFITFRLETSILVLVRNELAHHLGENPVPWHQKE